MSSIPYNYGSYIDAKVAMTDTGHVSAGKQIQSPASAGSRGLAKTTQFTNDRTQMQMGNSPIAESMIEIRNIMNRIDGINVPTNEMNELADDEKMEFTKILLDISVIRDRIERLSVSDEAKQSALKSLKNAEEALVALDETAVQEDIGDKGRIALEKAGFDPMKVKEYMAVFNDHGDTSDIDQMNMDKVGLADAMAMVLASHDVENESTTEDSGELSRLKELSGLEEDAGLSDQQKQGLQAIYKKYGNYEGYGNGDSLPIGNMGQVIDPGSTLWADDKEYKELDAYMKKMGYDGFSDAQDKDEDFFDNAMKEMPISSAMQDDISKVLGNDYYQKPDLAKAAKDYMSSSDESTSADSGELSRLKELSGIEEDAGLTDQQKKGLEAIAKKYKGREGYNGDFLPIGYIKAIMSTGVGTDGMDGDEVEAFAKKLGKRVSEIEDEWEDFETLDNITNAMKGDINDVLGNGWDVNQALASAAQDYLYDLTESYEPFPEGDEFDIEEDEDFEEVLGPLGFPEDETELFDAEYQGRKVPLNKPMRGDVKKFKVYVKDPKTGNVKKVNFGHGGTSAKRPTMRIRKSNPKARKSFRARHNCANPGPKTKARYWSCRKW